ncbi:DUF4440 domain-containing protein [Telluribacter sp. SYSU D00476]|uniref:YybH family protein n=1 Tax=Telluribacter sp. SYSU D00476 TaxID=2811430 RepID=UPI001FF173AA|nr:DUF4440 domain-containing protein [Telluribacter sp. SYSU D00476]
MQTQTTESITGQIRQCNDAFEAAFVQQDSASVAALYTPDALLLPPGYAEFKGIQAVRDFWRGAMEMGVARIRLTTVEAEEHGDTATEIGNFVISSATGDTIDQGKYLVIWKRKDGRWYLHRDIWNSSQSAV